jgi:hypothetical protein
VPSEIHFQSELHSSEFSHIFLVVVRNCTCVMKVVSQKVVLHSILTDIASIVGEGLGNIMSLIGSWTFTSLNVRRIAD